MDDDDDAGAGTGKCCRHTEIGFASVTHRQADGSERGESRRVALDLREKAESGIKKPPG
ncbi:MAG: hypothetical protein H7335_20535 [Massilia sp.]|nr:hypothetical protein [Massilia sp.]